VKNYKSVADFFNRQEQLKKNLTLRGDFCVMGKPRQTSQTLHTTRCGTTAHLIVRTRARDLTDRPNNNKKNSNWFVRVKGQDVLYFIALRIICRQTTVWWNIIIIVYNARHVTITTIVIVVSFNRFPFTRSAQEGCDKK